MRKLPTLALCALAMVATHTRSAAVDAAPDGTKAQCIASYEQGQTLRHDGKLAEARKQLLLCMRDVCPPLFRKDCDQWLKEVEQTMPSIVVVAKGAKGEDLSDVTVSIDGEVVAQQLDGKDLQVDPGNHVIRFEHGELPPIEQSVLIRIGEKHRALTVRFKSGGATGESEEGAAAGKGTPVPASVWVLGGIGVVALGSFAYFGTQGRSDVDGLQSCKPYCEQSDVDSARTKLMVADVSLGIGVVSLGIAAYKLFTRTNAAAKESSSAGPRVHVAPMVGGGAFAGVTSSF